MSNTLHDFRFVAPTGDPSRPNDPAAWFRRPFTLTEAPQRATLEVTALGLVEPWLDGAKVGDEVLAPGWTSYRHRLAVSRHDVTDRLTPGEHVMGAVVGQGWARGPLANFFGEPPSNIYADRAALGLRLVLEYPDRTEIIDADADTRVTRSGPITSDSIYGGEHYDATRELTGWAEPGYDANDWDAVEPFGWDAEALFIADHEPIRAVETLPVVEVITTPSGRTVLDFGQNLAGWVRFSVHGPAGHTVTLRHAEVLERGEPAYEPLRDAAATDTYTLRGGREQWEPRFTYHGFRYAELIDWPEPVDPDAFSAVVVHSDMTRIGHFECSDERVNQLHRNVVWGLRGNFVGLPTDCPQRDERLGWTGDIHAFGTTAAFLYDVRGVLASWLADLAAEQADKGYVPWVVPDIMPHPSSPTALWSDVAVGLPWALFQAYGDVEVLRRQYPSMTAYVRQVEASLDANGLISSGFQYGDWLDPDAPADRPTEGKTDPYLMANAYFARMTAIMAETAALLGDESDAAAFADLAGRVRAAFLREYVAPNGRLVNESVTAYALAIGFGLLDDDQRSRAGGVLAKLVGKAGHTITTGFAGTPWVLPALTASGHVEDAYRMLLTERCPSFLYPITMGATTIWERWDSMRPDGTVNPSGMTSFNHYALGAVAQWLHETVAGLAPAEPGYRSIRVEPRPGGGLTHAAASVMTPHGRASVRWERDGDTLRVAVTVPDGCTARVVLPEHPDAATHEVGAGDHEWEYALPVAEVPDLTMDSTLGEVVAQPEVWERVQAVLERNLPGIPIDGHAPEAAALTLNGLVAMIPGGDGWAGELAEALGEASATG